MHPGTTCCQKTHTKYWIKYAWPEMAANYKLLISDFQIECLRGNCKVIGSIHGHEVQFVISSKCFQNKVDIDIFH